MRHSDQGYVYARENLARLLAVAGVSIEQLTERCGVDRRTIRAILQGSQQPRGQTLHHLAQGLGVSVDEFFVDPTRLLYRHFDQQTNPVVEEVMHASPELFRGWAENDFLELVSRVGTGGALTQEGAVAAAKHINRRRELFEKLAVLLETAHFEIVGSMLDAMYEQVTVQKGIRD